MPWASIIIATHNRLKDVRDCIDSISPESLRKHDVEIIVVDDASSDGTPEAIRSEFPHVIVLVNETNRGPSFSRNFAASRAKGRLLIFLDSDVVVTAGWLDAMRRNADEDTILIGATVDYTRGRPQGGPRRATFMGRSLPSSPERANTGASRNLAIPKRWFERVNGFDEELPIYFEDSDLCIRAGKAGCQFRFLTDAIVRHKGHPAKTGRTLFLQERNCDYGMLKAYERSPVKIAAFTALTATWVAVRVVRLALKGRFRDGGYIVKGMLAGYRQFFERVKRRRAEQRESRSRAGGRIEGMES